jgi:excinuclease ABC subunit C
MKDSMGRVIYIGKAKNLQRRLRSYIPPRGTDHYSYGYQNIKAIKLLSRIEDIEFVATRNETEAFLLESSLIKQYRPLFNIELKDQQKYTYLKITDEKFPRLVVARRNRNGDFSGPKGNVYGPFVYGSSKILSTGSLRRLFKIRICKELPKKPCLEFFIKNCEAPCINNVTREQYMEKVNWLHDVLSKKRSMRELIDKLRNDMLHASMNQNYEQAKDLRDTITRLESISIKQKIEVKGDIVNDEEFFGIIENPDSGIAHVLTLKRRKGVIMDRKHVSFDLVGDNSLSTFISQYYSDSGTVPTHIYTNQEIRSADSLREYLESLSGHRVSIQSLEGRKKGDKNEIMDLIMTNLMLYIKEVYHPSLLILTEILHLDTVPYIIDCFDISNLGTSIAVGACVRFVNGECSKSGYRRFRIRSRGIQNDFAMMEEVVSRRYQSICTEKNVNKGLPIPDLVLIDGGKGQLNSAARALRAVGLSTPCISIAKGNEEIYTVDRRVPLMLAANNEGLKLLQYMRDEAHRFSLNYNIRIRTLDRSSMD